MAFQKPQIWCNLEFDFPARQQSYLKEIWFLIALICCAEWERTGSSGSDVKINCTMTVDVFPVDENWSQWRRARVGRHAGGGGHKRTRRNSCGFEEGLIEDVYIQGYYNFVLQQLFHWSQSQNPWKKELNKWHKASLFHNYSLSWLPVSSPITADTLLIIRISKHDHEKKTKERRTHTCPEQQLLKRCSNVVLRGLSN